MYFLLLEIMSLYNEILSVLMHGKIDTCIFYLNVNEPFIFLINVRQFFKEYFVRRVEFVCKVIRMLVLTLFYTG